MRTNSGMWLSDQTLIYLTLLVLLAVCLVAGDVLSHERVETARRLDRGDPPRGAP